MQVEFILLVAGVPVAFVAGVLRGGFARTEELREPRRRSAGIPRAGRSWAGGSRAPSATSPRACSSASGHRPTPTTGSTPPEPRSANREPVAPARRSRSATGRSGPTTPTARCSPTTRRCAPRAGSSPSPWTTSRSPSSCWPGAHSRGSPGCGCSSRRPGAAAPRPGPARPRCRAGGPARDHRRRAGRAGRAAPRHRRGDRRGDRGAPPDRPGGDARVAARTRAHRCGP